MRLFLVLLCAVAAVAIQLDLNEDDDDTQLSSGKDTVERSSMLRGPKNFNRTGKIFSLFNVVQWKQGPCRAGSSMMGTCMTAEQCMNTMGGGAQGNCAAGFGVCCVIIRNTCGSTITANCTYIQNPGFPASFNTAGTCCYSIQKCNSNICRLRLDMDQFTISGPNTVPTPTPADTNGNCNIDSFTVTAPTGAQSPPVICGTNTGQHMYVDAVQGSNSLTSLCFNLLMGSFTPNLSRMWKIKVSQIPCGTNYTPESNCVQYYTGISGKVSTFNFAGTQPVAHRLNNQCYRVCVRQLAGYCSIRWSATPTPGAFGYSGMIGTDLSAKNGPLCKQDYITILGANNGPGTMCVSPAPATTTPSVDRLCGHSLNCISGIAMNVPIYSSTQPFGIQVHTNEFETALATNGNRGFCLNYQQLPC